MKAGQNIMDNEILNFTERLIPISDFSKGKTSKKEKESSAPAGI